jgi:mannose-1-phosphate guanylyltransferase/phosphomannomutase
MITKLFLETNKQREPYKITVSVLASKEIELIAQDYNVEVIRIKDTHSAMMESTREDKVLFVGGVWGNFIFPDFLFAADGMYSIGKILEMLSETGLKISKLDEELPVRYQYQKSVSCPWEHKGKVMRMAMNYSDSMDRELVDGVKIFFGNSSVLVLPDREKASFLVLSESNEPENAVELTKRYCSLVQQWRDDEND